ncbi:hypothetical protein JUJ52_03005 [Virgibacillus sp. AGTR]|uniref:hypothetical protein n=1 Tax=Virgibacillus sp. AGTR TaxID=2812055 RepID=UPI001D1663D6|nr:hypothetical protein [Virgibacillus sp. AGTR]MCC2248926.1 hypothetical protein [Virgibacillus sp. AGTR]
MIIIGILLLLVSMTLFIYIIKENGTIDMPDPIVASIVLLFGGVYATAEGIIGPIIDLTQNKTITSFEKLWIGVVPPFISLVVIGTIIGAQLRYKKYGNQKKRKERKTRGSDLLMNYENKGMQYAEKHGIVGYEVNGNIMTYKESFPTEGDTYTVSVDLDTMKETRNVLETDYPNKVTLLELAENRETEVFDYLQAKNYITCDYDTFQKSTQVYQTPHGVYINTPISEVERDNIVNKLLNVTTNELEGYKNAVDWLVQQNKHVYYIEAFNLYVRVCDTSKVTIIIPEESDAS